MATWPPKPSDDDAKEMQRALVSLASLQQGHVIYYEVYGELGRKPLEIIAKTGALSFWARLVTTTVFRVAGLIKH